jgi:hypothetical protein
MAALDRTDRICVLGAGSSGLAAARNLKAVGLNVDVLERGDDLGGVWNYGKPNARVYQSTRMISSKKFTQFPDFHFPAHYPDYPHHSQVLEYLRSYAARFGIDGLIEYGTSVERIEAAEDGRFLDVTTGSGETRRYGGLVVCNGHNWSPKYPSYPGAFTGQVLHSADYRTPDVLSGKRVLVVGGGNSGCDIACEAAQFAKACFHSTRRGYHYFPKYLLGQPGDRLGDKLRKLRVPLPLRRLLVTALLKLVVGSPERYGLPRPDHRLWEAHPIINTLLLYYVQHGAVRPKADIQHLDGDTVTFSDGTREPIDLLIYATGYNVAFPFMDQELLNYTDGRPALYYNVFHPTRDNVFVVGLIQPDSGQFQLVHWQSKAVALYLAGLRAGSPVVSSLRARKARADHGLSNGIRYQESPRHYLEVDHWSYLKKLQRLVRELSLPAAKRRARAAEVQRSFRWARLRLDSAHTGPAPRGDVTPGLPAQRSKKRAQG